MAQLLASSLISTGPLLAACLLAAALAAPAVAKESQYVINVDRPTPEWWTGPVRYIITKEEEKTYRSLKTEEERAHFIDIFWRRRDPTPATEYNEFKERYRNRALDANQLYGDTSTPGWKSDMGKVYMLVGPPDEMVRDRVARGKRGTVMWIYRQPPFKDLAPNTVIAFAQDVQGDYVLSTQPTWDSDVAHGLVMMGPRATDPDFNLPMTSMKDPLLLGQGVPFNQGEFETGFIYARMQTLPPKDAKLLTDVVVTQSSFEVFPFKSRYSFFKTDSENTLVAITLGLKTTSVMYRTVGGKEQPDLRIFGKLVDQDHPGNEVPISSQGAFAAAPENEKAGLDGFLLYQALVPLKPSRYLAVFAAEDRVASRVGSYRETIIVPDLSGADVLALSSIATARSLGPKSEKAYPAPFVFGSLNVVQAAETIFKKTDSLSFYYQIYNAKKDPTSGAAILDIDYDFFARGPEQDEALGNIHVGPTPSQVQAYTLPLERFQPGEFKLRITVNDKVAGTRATQELLFSIIP